MRGQPEISSRPQRHITRSPITQKPRLVLPMPPPLSIIIMTAVCGAMHICCFAAHYSLDDDFFPEKCMKQYPVMFNSFVKVASHSAAHTQTGRKCSQATKRNTTRTAKECLTHRRFLQNISTCCKSNNYAIANTTPLCCLQKNKTEKSTLFSDRRNSNIITHWLRLESVGCVGCVD